MKSVFVKPENIIIDNSFIRRRVNNKRFASIVEKNNRQKITPLLCIRVKRKFYLIGGQQRLFNILSLNQTGMNITRVKVDLY